MMTEQKIADLPKASILPDFAPFTTDRVNYFRPTEIRRAHSTVNRAIQLEVAITLSTDSCINALPAEEMKLFTCSQTMTPVLWRQRGKL